MEQAWRIALECGAAMCLVSGGYLFLLLRIWPRVFLRRYPVEIQKAVGPLSHHERKIGTVVSVPLFASLVAFPVWASYRMARQLDASFPEIFLAAYLTWMLFNAFDWLVLDELLIGFARPAWLVLKGAEHIPLSFNHTEHAIAFARGTLGGALLCLLVAGAVIALI